jgi:hypothetical protein
MTAIMIKLGWWLLMRGTERMGEQYLTESNAIQLRRNLENGLIQLAKKAKNKTPNWNLDDKIVWFWQLVLKSGRIDKAIQINGKEKAS